MAFRGNDLILRRQRYGKNLILKQCYPIEYGAGQGFINADTDSLGSTHGQQNYPFVADSGFGGYSPPFAVGQHNIDMEL